MKFDLKKTETLWWPKFQRPWSFVQDLRRDEIRGWWWCAIHVIQKSVLKYWTI